MWEGSTGVSFGKLGKQRRKSSVKIFSIMALFHDGETISLGQSLNRHFKKVNAYSVKDTIILTQTIEVSVNVK